MLRTPAMQTAARPAARLGAALHTSAPARANTLSRAVVARQTRARNDARRAELAAAAAATRAHAVLGTRPDSPLYANSELARTLVQSHELAPPTRSVPAVAGAPVLLPTTAAFGLGPAEQTLLFEHLPVAAADMAAGVSLARAPPGGAAAAERVHATHATVAGGAARALAALVDLRNAGARGIAFENRRRILKAFGGDGGRYNPGSPECQSALLTYKIRNLWEHLVRVPRDVANRRSLRALVHQRAKILKYLKRIDRERYRVCLERIGVEAEAVEGEIIV